MNKRVGVVHSTWITCNFYLQCDVPVLNGGVILRSVVFCNLEEIIFGQSTICSVVKEM